MKYRKLFPTSTNQTDCPEFCDPISTCPYGCYPYPDFYLFRPPPPPSLPPPISTDQSQNLSSNVIIIVSVLASFFLLLSYYLVIAKYCSGRTRLVSDGQDVADENQGPVIDHPIWFINTVGLQPSVINKITVFRYRKSDGLINESDCSVCLSEFQEDETLRLLPKCNHAFHIPCIDTWLRSHTNCPLCRAGILSNTWSGGNPSAPGEQNGLNLRPEEETQIGNSEGSEGLGENMDETGGGIGLTHVDGSKDHNSLTLDMPEEETQMDNSENKPETEDEIELLDAKDGIKGFENLKDGGNSNGCGVSSVFELQVRRRSCSMDFAMAVTENSAGCRRDFSQSRNGMDPIQDLENPKMNQVIATDSFTQSLKNNGPVSLNRSFSYGGRLFVPRHDRNWSSILPM